MTNKQAEKYYGTEPIISEALDGVILLIMQGEFFLLSEHPAAENPRCSIC